MALHWFVESNSILLNLSYIVVSAVVGVVTIVAVILVIMWIKQRADIRSSCTRLSYVLYHFVWNI